MIRVLLLGKGDVAIRVGKWLLAQESRYKLCAAVPVDPEPKWAASFGFWCGSLGLRTFPGGDWRRAVMCGRTYDLALSVFYDRLIGQELIDRCGRILNLHNGLLPQYRGCRPINWALKNGDSTAGVTLHDVTPRFDDGPIVAQVAFSIYPTDEVVDVYNRASEFGYVLLTETLPILGRIRPIPQDESQARYYTLKDAEQLGDRSGWTRQQSMALETTPTLRGLFLPIAATLAASDVSTKDTNK